MSGLRVLGLGRSQDLQLILVTCYFDSGVVEASEKTLLKMSSVQLYYRGLNNYQYYFGGSLL